MAIGGEDEGDLFDSQNSCPFFVNYRALNEINKNKHCPEYYELYQFYPYHNHDIV
jgi:hypothetical protein